MESIFVKKKTNGDNIFELISYYPQAQSNEEIYSNLGAGYTNDGIPYAFATPTSANRNNGNDILTRDWIPKDTRIVHTSGNEEISGIKAFKDAISYNGWMTCYLDNITIGTAPVNEKTAGVYNVNDSNGKNLLRLYLWYGIDKSVNAALLAYKGTTPGAEYTGLHVGYDGSGLPFSYAPSTRTDRNNGADIVTRDFIPKDTRIVHTSGVETIAGSKTFTDTLCISNVSPILVLRDNNYDATGSGGSGCYLRMLDKNDRVTGQLNFVTTNNFSYAVLTTSFLGDPDKNANITLRWDDATHSYFFPDGENSISIISLGSAGHKWKEVVAVNGTIQTSDARLKTTPENLPESILDAWEEVDFVQFKFLSSIKEKGLDNARLHSDLIAQSIESIFQKHGLDARKYGFFCWDQWDEEPEEKDSEGNIIHNFVPGGEQYSLRYEEALCMEAAYQRRRADRAEARITALEEELSLIKSKLNL